MKTVFKADADLLRSKKSGRRCAVITPLDAFPYIEKVNAVNCKKNSVVRRSVGADPVIIFPANNKVGIYVLNADVVPPLKLYTGWYGLTCMPEDFPDETTIDMLESAFPEANGRNLLRLEDHIRHEFVTLVCECDRDDAGKA